jgi:hypothetical protein
VARDHHAREQVQTVTRREGVGVHIHLLRPRPPGGTSTYSQDGASAAVAQGHTFGRLPVGAAE